MSRAKQAYVMSVLQKEFATPMDDRPLTEFDYSIFDHPRAHYTPDQKMSVVLAYLVTGDSKRAGKVVGIKDNTIRQMKDECKWWPEAVMQARKMLQDRLDNLLTSIIHKSLGQLDDRVENGNWKVVGKDEDGKSIKTRVPMDGKDLAVTASILMEKRSLMRGEPTAHRVTSTEDTLKKLERHFTDLSKRIQDQKHEKVIEVIHEAQKEESCEVLT